MTWQHNLEAGTQSRIPTERFSRIRQYRTLTIILKSSQWRVIMYLVPDYLSMTLTNLGLRNVWQQGLGTRIGSIDQSTNLTTSSQSTIFTKIGVRLRQLSNYFCSNMQKKKKLQAQSPFFFEQAVAKILIGVCQFFFSKLWFQWLNYGNELKFSALV